MITGETSFPDLENAPDLDDIRQVHTFIRPNIVRTPVLHADKISRLTKTDTYLKFENFQITNSFKDRGALAKILSLTDQQKRNGVVTMSAGNHAQAVAYHAQRLDIKATIVMPETTPFVKVSNTQSLGARVVLAGETISESQKEAERLCHEENLTFVHPYDDYYVIAGQGTIAIEFFEDQPDLDVLIVPVGGGGLISGISIVAKSLNPDIEIIGVEISSYPAMSSIFAGKEPVCGGYTLADGIAVKSIGAKTLPIAQSSVDDFIVVSEDKIEQAICMLANFQKTVVEGAGAAGLAAMLSVPDRFAGRKTGLVLCGGNIDSRILSSIFIRGLERDEKIIAFRIFINDLPGTLGKIGVLLGELGANIVEVSHQRMFLDVPAKGATLDIVAETRGASHTKEIMEALEARGYEVKKLIGTSR